MSVILRFWHFLVCSVTCIFFLVPFLCPFMWLLACMVLTVPSHSTEGTRCCRFLTEGCRNPQLNSELMRNRHLSPINQSRRALPQQSEWKRAGETVTSARCPYFPPFQLMLPSSFNWGISCLHSGIMMAENQPFWVSSGSQSFSY